MDSQDNKVELLKPIKRKWKVQTTKPNKCIMVAYIDARDVADRLDEVFGFDGWSDMYSEPQQITTTEFGKSKTKTYVKCTLTIHGEKRDIHKEDVGSESATESVKGAYSDAFKRAGVKLGIGRGLYSMPTIMINETKEYNNKLHPSKAGKILWGDSLSQECERLLKMKQG